MLRAFVAVSVAVSVTATLSLTFIGCTRSAAGPEPTPFQAEFPSAKVLNGRLGKGVNLGNALDAPKEGAWGVTLKADYFRWIADSGFTMVRIPACFSAHAGTESPYTIDPAFMDRVAWAVDQALSESLMVVLDMHHYNAMMEQPQDERPRFLAMWKQICKRFRDYPPEVLFELVNEPRFNLDAATWNDILAETIDTIRISQPGRTLVVGTSPWGGYSGLGTLKLPADSNLIVTVHYYEPHSFTHQGAPFVEGSEPWMGTLWRATPAQRAVLDQHMEFIRSWAAENNRPVFMGEFGTYQRVDSLSRALYTAYLSRRIDSAGFSSALWNFSSDFGLMNDTTEIWKGYLVNAFLRPGQNRMLDSILASTIPIDPTVYVTWEDFEDSLVDMPTSARLWRERKGLPLEKGGANWYAFYSDSSNISSGEGTRIHTYQEVDSGAARNFSHLVGPWGSEGRGMHAKMRLNGGNYPFGGIGAGILGGWDSTKVDLTKLTAIQFRTRGSGEWIIQVVTDSVFKDTVENWGHMSWTFRPKPEWETVIIPAAALAPKPYSKQADVDKLTWEDVRRKAIAIDIMNGQSYNKKADTTLELWIDDIRLIGVTEADLGM